MNRISRIFYVLIFCIMMISIACQQKSKEKRADIQPPDVEKIPKELTMHGDKRIDNYYWLRERENPKVIEYLKAENAYTKEVMKHTEKLQDKIYNEIVNRIEKNDNSVPYKKNGYFYYRRYEEGREYPVYCRKKGNLEADEEIILDVNELAKEHDYYHVANLAVSPDNRILAYSADSVSRRKYGIFFKNLTTGEYYNEQIPNTSGYCDWANDNKTVFFARKNDVTLRSERIFKHILGTETDNDKEVFFEEDETFSAYVYKSKSEKYMIIASQSTTSSEYRFLDAANPDGEFTVFQPREEDHEYFITHRGNKFLIKTNWEARNFRLMETPENETGKDSWKEVIPHRENVLLEGIEPFTDFIVIEERKDGLSQFRVMNTKQNTEHYIDFGEATYTAWISTNPEMNTKTLRYGYSSLTTPESIYDYDMINKQAELKKREKVVGEFSPDDYFAERLYAKADDGAEIPISLVYKKGIKKDGTNPMLLYAYGSYGATMDPYFSMARLSLLDRGFVFAIAHVRGGQSKGRQWYENGKLLKKKNTFTDFITCAEYLIEKKYTNSEKLFAQGGSAGGLLMGAIANMRPDLFKGIIADVPWVDVVTTMLDPSIPLTTVEYDEWGNPNDKEYYEYMLSYSPYDNVKEQDYPAMLVLTGFHDSQVQYFEPVKWVAKLRDKKTDSNLLIIDINMEVGHGGASGRFKRYKETALKYAFMLDQIMYE